MSSALIIFAFLLARVRDVLPREAQQSLGIPASSAREGLLAFAWPWLAVALVLCAQEALTRVAARGLDRTGERRFLVLADRARLVARSAIVCVVAFAVLGLRWDATVRNAMGDWVVLDELAIASPILIALVAGWWIDEPIDRRLREAALMRDLDQGRPLRPIVSRATWVWTQARLALLVLLPLSLMIAWHDIAMFLPGWLMHAYHDDLVPMAWPVRVQQWNTWLQWTGSILILLCSPVLLRFSWDTVPLTIQPLRDLVASMARTYRVRLGPARIWRTHGQLANAAVVGFVWPFRALLLSDALLQALSPREVEFVVAHEVAHVRERHTLWLALAVLASLLGTATIFELAASHAPGGVMLLFSLAGTLVSLGIAIVVLGLVSRRFEWHADAFALAHLARSEGPGPAHGFITPVHARIASAALGGVALANAIPVRHFTFRHGTILERQTRLDAIGLASPPAHADGLSISRSVRRIKAVIAFAMALTILLIAWQTLSQPSTTTLVEVSASKSDYR